MYADAAWHALCEKWTHSGYQSLSKTEKLWLNTRALIDAINDGGIISYYYNSGADSLEDCMGALRELESDEVLAVLQETNGLFPDGRVPTDVDGRNAVIGSWPDDGRIDRRLSLMDRRLSGLLPVLERRREGYLHQSTGI